ncbi:hypothetical protein PIB30_074591 [Stylosanthes scabra]|uniref:UBA domain-containing protein n=1 Tax=Stylosanthes scabra TaxID=79078 RepID=A0ABU6ZNN3_9FABA|nr:hypothetical protein [Stylosanthes scabra]
MARTGIERDHHLNQHEATSILIDLCYTPDEANRALQMSNGDVAGAIDFVIEEDAKEVQKFNGLNQQRFEIQEGKMYGFTSNKAVDIEKWKALVSIGFYMELAAEALGRNENDIERALDDLIIPKTNSTLQKKAIDFAIEKAVHMGFERSRVVAAFEAGGTLEDVIQRLKEQREEPSDLSKAEEQNEEINGQFNLDINISPKNEGATILFYLRLIELALRRLCETEG